MHHFYIHIPFCVKKCNYCSFYSTTDLSLIDKYTAAIIEEIENYSSIYKETTIETIYIGGGTPSLLPTKNLAKIYDHLQTKWTISKKVEFSIEVNPETVTRENLTEYNKIGINRISVGVQSFNDDELKYLGRIHNSEKAKEALDLAADIFENMSMDLIYGLPDQQKAAVEKNIKEVLKFSPNHISHYELTFEEGTPLYNNDQMKNDDPSLYNHSQILLKNAGLHQYEISNYAIPGYECRHNLAYWSDKSYTGLGPSAHSYDRDKKIRWANKPSIEAYFSDDKKDFVEDAQDIDKIIMGLRMTDGIDKELIANKYQSKIDKLIKDGHLKKNNNKIAFTEKSTLLANQILLKIYS